MLGPRCSAVHRAVAGLLKMCNYILHHVSPFCTIFFHYTTHHVRIDKYREKIKRFVLKSLFNGFVGVLG